LGVALHGFFQFGNDVVVVVWVMRKCAFRATLDIMQCTDVLEIAAAMLIERIEWTITKQAVETDGRDIFMTRKIAAFRVCKKFGTVFHKTSL